MYFITEYRQDSLQQVNNLWNLRVVVYDYMIPTK